MRLNGVTGTDRIIKIRIMEVPFTLPNGQAVIYRITNVSYVSQCPVNLISSSKMKIMGNMILNMDTNTIINRTIRELKAYVTKISDIFELNTAYSAFAALSTPIANSKIWHRRIRHLDYDNLKKLVKVADGIILFDARELFDSKFKRSDCDPCHRTLAKRKPFDKASKAE